MKGPSAPARHRICRDVIKPMVSGNARRSCRLVKSKTIVSLAASACVSMGPGGRTTMLPSDPCATTYSSIYWADDTGLKSSCFSRFGLPSLATLSMQSTFIHCQDVARNSRAVVELGGRVAS